MSRRDLLRQGEERVISVTPVSRGVLRPALLTVTTFGLIVEASGRFSFVHRVEGWLELVFVVPLLVVTLTRIWRWRSHKIHVTTERVVLEGGVLQHQRASIEYRDVLSTRVDQRVTERLTRRGLVYLDTSTGLVVLGRVRHPDALCRFIDASRNSDVLRNDPLDTVYGFDEPSYYQPDLRAEEWPRLPYE